MKPEVEVTFITAHRNGTLQRKHTAVVKQVKTMYGILLYQLTFEVENLNLTSSVKTTGLLGEKTTSTQLAISLKLTCVCDQMSQHVGST